MTLTDQTEMDVFLEEALATGRIRQSKSPLGAPVFFIKKKDGKLRFVQDYWALNAITRKNQYLLPLIDDLIHQLKDVRYFTKLDVHWGYNNVHIRKGDEWKAAFRTNRGLFEPLVMYFGSTNSLATFQTMMNEIFQDLAIIRGLEEWRHRLEGARHSVEIWTNHKNLEYFRVAQKLNRQQARWSLYLSRFNFTLHHKPGRSMGKPDALSRQADHRSGQGDNSNLTLLDPELFWIHALAGARLEGDERNILREVQLSLRDDVQEESVAKAARELRKDKGRGTIKSTEWSERVTHVPR
jgi:hypothetical protein